MKIRQKIPYKIYMAGVRYTDSPWPDKVATRLPRALVRRAWEYTPAVLMEGVATVLCKCVNGHVVVDDHCGIQEHRYCATCGKGMPNADVYTGPWK